MISLAFLCFLGIILLMGFKRPFFWVLGFIYVDILTPQKIAWGVLSSIPISLLLFIAAFGGWLVMDSKEGSRFSVRQGIMLFFLLLCGYTTLTADFPVEAASKWSWVWKSIVFGIFLPLTLSTRLRVEAVVLIITLSVGSILISSGLKTVLSGGGYGMLGSYVRENSGIYEGSTLSTIAITTIPLIIWLVRYGTIIRPDWIVKSFAAGLVIAALVTPIGLQTRTGLLCIGVLAVVGLRDVKHRILILSMAGVIGIMALPFLPSSYTERMSTIRTHQADTSASTRVAVWMETLKYVQRNPMGGGFDAYLGNKLRYNTKEVSTGGDVTTIESEVVEDEGRAYHSAYFEVLGEQGWLGLSLWLSLQIIGLFKMEMIRRRFRKSENKEERSDAALATALQIGHIVFLFGSLFVGVAYQPFIFMLLGVQIGLAMAVKRRDQARREARRQYDKPRLQPVGLVEQA